MRLGLIHVAQETCSFDPTPTTLEDFRAFGLHEGSSVLEWCAEAGEVGGFLDVVRGEPEVEPVPILRAFAVAGGPLDRASLAFLESRLREGLRRAGPIDGLALQLHGACAAEGEPDVDGRIVALCGAQLGPSVPIVLSLDHHANLTRRMVEGATAIVAHRTQPHDVRETGRLATSLLIRILRERLSPVVAWEKLPLLAHQEQVPTDRAPMKVWFDRARALEAEPGVLACARFPLQPWLDVPEAGWAVAVTTAGDRASAERSARELADLAWSLRHEFQSRDAMPIDRAFERAERAPPGLVALGDVGDTVLGGAAGDSPLLPGAILARPNMAPALVPIVAPAAVGAAHRAGQGARLELALGGELSGFFRPLVVEARVRRLGEGRIRLAIQWQDVVDHGRVALLEVGPALVLSSERRGVGGVSPELWCAFGVEPRDARLVVLETAARFQDFRPLAVDAIRVDTPGPATSDLASLPWKHVPRPIFPLDPVEDRRGWAR